MVSSKSLKRFKKKRKELRRLWKKYYGVRNELFDCYWDWAKNLAKIFSKCYKSNFNEVSTDAALGLSKAIENDRIHVRGDDREFKRYATEAIRTSIIDGLKEMRGVKGGGTAKTNIPNIPELVNKKVNFGRVRKVREEVGAIEEFVSRLPPFEKNLIYRRYFLGEKLRVIGDDLGLSQPALSNKCREIINRMIEETGVGPVA